MNDTITTQPPFLGILPREQTDPESPTLVVPPGFERTEVEATPGALGEIPEGEFWFTIKVKPEAGILRIYQHLGSGRGREAPIAFDKLPHGLRQLSWVLHDILDPK
jgi:hypothetical protein